MYTPHHQLCRCSGWGNRITVQALWRFNCLAAEIAWVMTKAPLEQITRERRRRRLAEAEGNATDDAAEDADDEDED